jgi:ATP-dependent DNA helicase DinG
VYWVERSGKANSQLELHAAPVQVAEFLRHRLFARPTSVIMTSATLATSLPASSEQKGRCTSDRAPAENPPLKAVPGHGKNEMGLAYFTQRVGAESAHALQLGSPFDFQRQMKLYVVDKMPDPRSGEYAEALEHWIKHFVRLTHGKAFVLFTNFKLMQEMGDRLAGFFEDLGLEYFVQGTGMPRTLMLEKFKTNVDSVLFGTDSFWQGVDVPGEALSNVIITRLPFAVPDHPLIEARLEYIEARGGNAFREFSLPEAILKFRQGVGRLIRTRNDQGIVVVLDNRILNKQYGQAFLNSLPECPLEIV